MNNNKQESEDSIEGTLNEIFSYFIKWIGIIVFFLCASSFFISTEWLVELILETSSTSSTANNDSDFGQLLVKLDEFIIKVEEFMINLAIWLKNLPLFARIIGLVVGGLLWIMNYKD